MCATTKLQIQILHITAGAHTPALANTDELEKLLSNQQVIHVAPALRQFRCPVQQVLVATDRFENRNAIHSPKDTRRLIFLLTSSTRKAARVV